jgi:hypothetical protein
MKKHYIFLILTMLAGLSYAQTVTITKVIEAPCDNPFLKTIELAVEGTVDFANDDIQLRYSQNGAGFAPLGTPNLIDISVLGSQSNTYVYLIRDLGLMQADFPSTGITTANSVDVTASTNGNDAYQLTKADGTVLSQFGEDLVDGTGTAWEHVDTFFSRKVGNTNTGWDINDWDTPGTVLVDNINYLDGKGLCVRTASQDPGAAPGPSAYENFISLGSWKTLGVNNRELIGFSFSPNPVNDGLVTIKSQGSSVKNITLFDMLGRSVLQTKLNSEVLDVRAIKSGLYLLQVSIGDRSSTSKLIIK